jgi:hypothetical protein
MGNEIKLSYAGIDGNGGEIVVFGHKKWVISSIPRDKSHLKQS